MSKESIRSLFAREILDYLKSAVQSPEYDIAAQTTKLPLIKTTYALFKDTPFIEMKIMEAGEAHAAPLLNPAGRNLLGMLTMVQTKPLEEVKMDAEKYARETDFTDLYRFLETQEELVSKIALALPGVLGMQTVFPNLDDYIDHRANGMAAGIDFAKTMVRAGERANDTKEDRFQRAAAYAVLETLQLTTGQTYRPYIRGISEVLYNWDPSNN